MDYTKVIRICQLLAISIGTVLFKNIIKDTINNYKEQKFRNRKFVILDFVRYIILLVLYKYGDRIKIEKEFNITYHGDVSSILPTGILFDEIKLYNMFSIYLKYEKNNVINKTKFIIYFFDPNDKDKINFNDLECIVKENMFFVVTEENDNISLYINKMNNDIELYSRRIEILYKYILKAKEHNILIQDHTNI